MHPAIAFTVRSVDAALEGLFKPQVLIPLAIALGVWWYLIPGSYRLAGQSEDLLLEQAAAVCAAKGADFNRQPAGMLPAGAPAALVFSCE